MNLIHDDLYTVLDAVKIKSPVRYSLLGESRTLEAADAADPLEPGGLVAVLAEEMYARLYIRPSFPQPRSLADVLAQRDFMASLSAANNGRGTWEPGWTVGRIEEDGRAVAGKNEVEFRVPALGWRGVGDGEIRPGAPCEVAVPKERRHLIWGFYFAVGDAGEETHAGDGAVEPIVRYYWHLLAGAAAPFVAAATSLLNAARVPFRLKVLSDPNDFHRADSGVIFVRRHYLSQVSEIVAGIHGDLRSGLRRQVPLFTRRLADGLGYAEDPANAMSFGQHRCRLAARALWDSFARGELDRDARALALAQAFRAEGLDPLRPYRRLDSRDDDTLLPPVPSAVSIQISADLLEPGPRGQTSRTDGTTLSNIDAAARIGEALCRSAYWVSHGQGCNWMGRSIAEIAEYGGPITPTTAACGPDLYAGSAGIGLYLAQLFALTGDLACARTALGAIDRSIRQLDCVSPSEAASPLSFHCGHLGVAHAARRVGLLTGHVEHVLQAATILDQVIEAVRSPHELDLIGGNAGAIPVLLSLGRESGLERCHDLAIALGEELCRTAVDQATGWAWDPEAASGSGMGPVPQTGLSHGASGMGLALFELYAATGRRDFLKIARGAFAFEDALFDPANGNWPDRRRNLERPTFARSWCHGAPGIALTRLRAAMLDHELRESYRARARIAIATTLGAIEENLVPAKSDATLCHGLAGLGEIVWLAGQLLEDPTYRDRALDLGRALINRHSASEEWPSGVPSRGPNPSLMLGTAGIGYWLLRLHDPEEVPSVLLMNADAGKCQ
jgi:hypothetical protein